MHDELTFDLNGLHVPRSTKPKAATEERGGPRQLTVNPFTVVVDTREQLPWSFTGMADKDGSLLTVPTVVRGLASGDYSIEGLEDRVLVERKSMDDLFGSVTWQRDRFEREVLRMDLVVAGHQAAERIAFACVMIEATWPEICSPLEFRPGWENRTDPRSVEGTIAAWSLRFPRVHWWACGDRRGAECRTFTVLRAFWKEQGKR